MMTHILWAAILFYSYVDYSSVFGKGLSDHAIVGSSANFPLSGVTGLAHWTLSTPASDGQGCDVLPNVYFNTTQIVATVRATDSAECCLACRARSDCLASVFSESLHRCDLHNATGLASRIQKNGSYACFPGPDKGPAISVPAHVPGDHLTDLQTAKLIDDPLFNVNFRNSSVWGGRTWTYTATFTPPVSLISRGSSILLVFDGVKMGAEVSLNGQVLGTVRDQFLRVTYEIANKLVPGKMNTLKLVFDLDIFVNGRFMACSGGWDWAPYASTYNRWGTKVFTLGIWKDVYLVPVAANAAAITHFIPAITYTGAYPIEPLTDDTAAPFHINVTLHTWSATDTTGTLMAIGQWNSTSPASTSVSIPAGEGTVTIPLTAHHVKLWWPNGFGSQPLYNITATLQFTNALAFSSNNQNIHVTARRRVGFRYAVLVTGNDTDPSYVKNAATQDGSAPRGGVTTFIFRVNGAPVFAKGANMVPMEELEGRSDSEALQYLVRNAASAGFTILRNWGGGIFQYDVWYDALDEFGILCYQDLMYAQGGAFTYLWGSNSSRRNCVPGSASFSPPFACPLHFM